MQIAGLPSVWCPALAAGPAEHLRGNNLVMNINEVVQQAAIVLPVYDLQIRLPELKSGKSAGIDGIPVEIWKALGHFPLIVRLLTRRQTRAGRPKMRKCWNAEVITAKLRKWNSEWNRGRPLRCDIIAVRYYSVLIRHLYGRWDENAEVRKWGVKVPTTVTWQQISVLWSPDCNDR